MNERIKQLARQSGFSTELSEAMTTRHNTASGLEKFANLIIKECVGIIETQRVSVGNSPSGEMAAKWTMDTLRECRSEIKEHFGVK